MTNVPAAVRLMFKVMGSHRLMTYENWGTPLMASNVTTRSQGLLALAWHCLRRDANSRRGLRHGPPKVSTHQRGVQNGPGGFLQVREGCHEAFVKGKHLGGAGGTGGRSHGRPGARRLDQKGQVVHQDQRRDVALQ